MSNISKFQSVFDVNFPAEIADQVLARMQMLYGEAFDKKFGEIDPKQLTFTTCTVLNGLSEADLRRGLERMNTEKWCPSLPEFRGWCEQAGDWWTAEQAWAKALLFSNNPESPITRLAKCVLDEVQHVLKVEGQKAAHAAFRDIYNDYLGKAKQAGRKQEMWEADKAIGFDEDKAERERKGIPCPPELVAQLRGAKSFKRVRGAA